MPLVGAAAAAALWSLLGLRSLGAAAGGRGLSRGVGAGLAAVAFLAAGHAGVGVFRGLADIGELRAVVRQAAADPPPLVETPLIQPPPAPSPSPSPSPSVVPATPQAAPAPAGGSGASETSGGGGAAERPTFVKPTLEQCQPAMVRMEVVLLIELLLECIFAFVGCVILNEKDLRKTLKKWFSTMRVLYTIPVVLLNFGVIWLGAAPTGSCLQHYAAVRLLYVHLILYATYSILLCLFSLLVSKSCMLIMAGRPATKNEERACGGGYDPKRTNDWGMEGGGVEHPPPSTNFTFVDETVTADPAPLGFTCCGLFRIEP